MGSNEVSMTFIANSSLALLPEDDRSWLGTLVFSDEPRVRKGVGRFVSGVWEEWVEEKIGELDEVPVRASTTTGRGRGRGRGKSPVGANDVDRDKVGIKGLGRLLVRWGRALERERRKAANGDKDEEEEDEDEEEGSEERDGTTDGGADGNDARGIVPALVSAPEKKDEGHIGLAVEALWDEMSVVRDWEGILDMLVLDHSASAENGAPTKKAGKKAAVKKGGKQTNGDADGQEESEDEDDNASTGTRVDQSWRLSEVEEGALLEVLVASLRKTIKDVCSYPLILLSR